MRSMSEGRLFYVFLEYFMTMKKDAESVRQYRCNIHGGDRPTVGGGLLLII